MQWENLTASDFTAAVKQTRGVCLLPLTVIEKHGDQLPLGTDLFIGMEVARRAAEIEPAILFPPFYFTQILEAQHQPGTIALGGGLMLRLLEAVCDEIGRNGVKKIILVPAHGGNRHLAPLFVQLMLEKEKDYMVYLPQLLGDPGFAQLMKETMESELDYHGGEMETSLILAIFPHLVKMGHINTESGSPLKRLQHLPGVETPVSWYANFPDHYAGDARPATVEKGERILQYLAQHLAGVIRAIKADRTAPELYEEFFRRTQH
jgi:creatinine amidohydrolase